MSWRSAVLELSNQLLKLRMYSIKTKVLDSEENSQTEILEGDGNSTRLRNVL